MRETVISDKVCLASAPCAFAPFAVKNDSVISFTAENAKLSEPLIYLIFMINMIYMTGKEKIMVRRDCTLLTVCFGLRILSRIDKGLCQGGQKVFVRADKRSLDGNPNDGALKM
jgi:hypothetical protein